MLFHDKFITETVAKERSRKAVEAALTVSPNSTTSREDTDFTPEKEVEQSGKNVKSKKSRQQGGNKHEDDEKEEVLEGFDPIKEGHWHSRFSLHEIRMEDLIAASVKAATGYEHAQQSGRLKWVHHLFWSLFIDTQSLEAKDIDTIELSIQQLLVTFSKAFVAAQYVAKKIAQSFMASRRFGSTVHCVSIYVWDKKLQRQSTKMNPSSGLRAGHLYDFVFWLISIYALNACICLCRQTCLAVSR